MHRKPMNPKHIKLESYKQNLIKFNAKIIKSKYIDAKPWIINWNIISPKSIKPHVIYTLYICIENNRSPAPRR